MKKLIENGVNPDGMDKLSEADRRRVYKAITTGAVSDEDAHAPSPEEAEAKEHIGVSVGNRQPTEDEDQSSARNPHQLLRQGVHKDIMAEGGDTDTDNETKLSSPFGSSLRRGKTRLGSPKLDPRVVREWDSSLKASVLCGQRQTIPFRTPVDEDSAKKWIATSIYFRTRHNSGGGCFESEQYEDSQTDLGLTLNALYARGAVNKRATKQVVLPPKMLLDDFCERYELTVDLRRKLEDMKVPGPHTLRLIRNESLEKQLEIGEIAELRDAEERWMEDLEQGESTGIEK
ncbi:hypothetical protein V5O48_015971 [Marasmius crinis-equi]|uniref:Uncharacterized protein n=1 Tax=Marasmius crinis-equi TaxID=585013 RepID=A0ABR3ESZ9_9AGAR